MKRTGFILLLFVVFLYSCDKSDVMNDGTVTLNYDTIRPLSYLPVYPGSYWIYDDGDSVFTESEYKLYSYYLDRYKEK